MRHEAASGKDLRKRLVANAEAPGIGAEGRHHDALAVAGKTTPLQPARPRRDAGFWMKVACNFAHGTGRLVAEYDRTDRDFARNDAAEIGGQRRIVIAGNPDPVAPRL